jgi:predicted ATPase/DNA-binding SARP family transcriptional activator
VEPELVLLPRVAHRGREITAPRVRDLLAVLALDLRSGAGTARLVEGLWPDARPEHPAKALQVVVSRARGLLGHDLIAGTPTGYRIALPAEHVDVAVLRAAATAVRGGSPADVLERADAALALWDGTEPGEPGEPLADLRAAALPDHAALVRARTLALAALGRAAEALAPLEELAAAQPRDEEVLAALLRAEAAVRGPASALARYASYRRALRDELGAEPGPEPRAAYAGLLREGTPPVRHGVAHEPNALLGRAADVAAVGALLRTSRVVSIVGPGGLGKTRLAHAVARDAPQRTVRFVGLAAAARDADVAVEVAATVAGGTRGPQDPVGQVAEALGDGLLVLDNCEHVRDGAADLAAALVARTRDLRVLTTSRAPLGLSSEVVHAPAGLAPATAAELFTQRARAARPGVELPEDAVAAVCARLDGLPLAIELAAARVRTLSVAEIADGLADRFALLRGGPRDAPERHRTLHAVVDWSWTLLAPADRAALAALSIFPDGFTAAAAARVGAGDALEHLVDQSLVVVADTRDGTRLRMLETVRAFAATHRDDAATEAYLAWARELGLARHDALLGPHPAPALAAVRAEQDNLLAAMRLAIARDDGPTMVATAAVLVTLWTVETNHPRVLAVAPEVSRPLSHLRPEPGLVEATRTAAVLLAVNGLVILGARATRAMAVLRRLPPAPPDTVVRALSALLLRTPAEVMALCDSPEPILAGVACGLTTFVHQAAGDLEAALQTTRRMTAIGEWSPYLGLMAQSQIGDLCVQLERGAEACTALERALAAQQELLPVDEIGLRWGLVQACLQAGDVDGAQRWMADATRRGTGESYGVLTFGIAMAAEIALARGEVEGGLASWRRAVAALADEPWHGAMQGTDPWACELRSAAVVAHARHGCVERVTDVVAAVLDDLDDLLSAPPDAPPPVFPVRAVTGSLLLALAAVAFASEEAELGARATVLAERFRFQRGFHPTMASAAARDAARRADARSYAAATAEFADRDDAALRAAALDLLAGLT